MKRTIKVGCFTEDEAIAGDYRAIVIVSSDDFRSPDTVYLTAHVAIDQYGGHRHYFKVWTSARSLIETESLAGAVRVYRKSTIGE